MLSRRTYLKSMGAMLAASRLRALTPEPDFGAYSDAEKEKLMLAGKIISAQDIGHGVTHPVKVKLELAGVTHDAAIQMIDKDLPDFFATDGTRAPSRDCWRYNIAAYKLDRLLGLNMVTVEVQRAYKGKPAAFSWWVDDVMFEEAERVKKDIAPPDPESFDRQRCLCRVFDELIINIDRNLGNLLITKSWKLAMIDHSRSFNIYRGIRNTENLTRCSRSLMEAMKGLTAAGIDKAEALYLTAAERAAVLGRRDRIVEFFQNRAKEKGEENVLFG
ncbi:MAG TPA: hypothetical protein VMH28_07975 [Candidatus Acidoferrales bacterium]|nr:hypothetical protein [Candidatus Acidoferrales bacterium]